MQLYTTPATPFGRTVEIVARELDLTGDIEIVPTTVAPTKDNPEYQAVNPLRRIPALVADDGTLITDSALIAQYLAEKAGDRTLFAVDAPDRWAILNDYMIAKGVCECLVSARYEGFVRPEARRWQPWTDDLLKKVHAALARFEAAPPATGGGLTIAAIALGAALGYMDFRFAAEPWRERYPNLAAWYAALDERPSFAGTRPA